MHQRGMALSPNREVCCVGRMVEVRGDPEGAVTDVAMAQWGDASVVAVRASVAKTGQNLANPVWDCPAEGLSMHAGGLQALSHQ